MVPVSWDVPRQQPEPVVQPVPVPVDQPVFKPVPVPVKQPVFKPVFKPVLPREPAHNPVLPPGSPITGPPKGRRTLRDRAKIKSPIRNKDYVP